MCRLSQIMIGLLSICALSACDSSSDSIRSVRQWSYNYSDPTVADKAISNWVLTCDKTDGLSCPNTIAQILIKKDIQISACTAELIGNDTLLTNSHCLGEGKENPSVLCDNMTVVFAANSSGGAERAHCKKVLFKSDISAPNYEQPDFAIFQIDHELNRGYQHILRTGLGHEETVHIARINPSVKGFGTVVASTCTIVHGTYFRPLALTDVDPIQMMKGCVINRGNSGSAVTDDSGRIKGLLYATPLLKEMRASPDPKVMAFTEKLDSFNPAIITNSSCMDYPFENAGPISPTCAADTKGKTVDAPSLDFSEAEDTLATQFRETAKATEVDFRVGYHPSARRSAIDETLTIKPFCFKTPAQWVSAIDKSEDSNYAIKTVVPQWLITLEVNDDIQASAVVRPLPPVSLEINFAPKNLISGTSAQVGYNDPTALAGDLWGQYKKEIWPTCP
jgi:Trypsin